MHTAYRTIITSLERGENVYVLGASQGEDVKKTQRFFLQYGLNAKNKGLKVRLLFNENARKYVAHLEKEAHLKFNKKFIFKNTPVEVAVARDVTAIIMLKAEPIVILIKDKQTADSFITYFEELWKIAKP